MDDNITSLTRYVEENLRNRIDLKRASLQCGINRTALCRLFKAQTGKTVRQFIIDARMKKAKQLLLQSSLEVKQISFEVGYKSAQSFSLYFKKRIGTSPRVFRKRFMR